MAKIRLDPDQLSVTTFEPVRPAATAVAASGEYSRLPYAESCHFDCFNYETMYSCDINVMTNCC